LKEGRLIVFEAAEQLRQRAFHIAGRSDVLDQFIQKENLAVINREGFGHLASLAVQGRLDEEQRQRAAAANLDVSPISLQKLFIYLTESTDSRESVKAPERQG
jgi:ABC-2 type transport system ATP-binding protein